jgi:hypothetical protein
MLSGQSPWGEFTDTQVNGTLARWQSDLDDSIFDELTNLPEGAPPKLVEILKRCLVVPPEKRPSFAILAQTLGLTSLKETPTSMEGISQAEAADLLKVARNAPRWVLPDGSTELGFVVEQRQGDHARRIHITTSPPVSSAKQIKAAVLDTVHIEGQLYKVCAITLDARGNVAAYVVQWLQHWQVPSPCDKDLLGWSDDYRAVAEALSSGAVTGAEQERAKAGEKRLRAENSREIVAHYLIKLDTEYITFNDIKEMIVVPLLKRKQAEDLLNRKQAKTSKGEDVRTSSLAYLSILGEASAESSAASHTRARTFDGGKGLLSRRANIFFSWSFTQLFGDFVDAFSVFLEETVKDERSRRRAHAWVSPLSLSQDPAEIKKLETEDWADSFDELVRTIGRDGLGTVLLWTPPANPEPITRMWCIWEMYMTKKTSSRLTVQAPRGVSISATTPVVSSEDAQDNGGAAAKLVRRIIENDPGVDYHDIDDFIKDSFGEAVHLRHWQQRRDPTSGAPYWHNAVTGVTSWTFMGGDRSSKE